MSTQPTITNPGGGMQANYDTAKLFVFGNWYYTATYNNATGSAITLSAGTVMGRINSSGYIVEMQSGNTDGSQIPIGVCANDYVIPANSPAVINYCHAGQVNQSLLIWKNGTDTLTTLIQANTNVPASSTVEVGLVIDILLGKGIKPIAISNTTKFE